MLSPGRTFSRWLNSAGLPTPRWAAITALPAWPGFGPVASHEEVHRLLGTSIEPSLRSPTAPTQASTPIVGMRRREGVIGPETRLKVSAWGGAGAAVVTIVPPISWVPGPASATVAGAAEVVDGAAGAGVPTSPNAIEAIPALSTTATRPTVNRPSFKRRRPLERRWPKREPRLHPMPPSTRTPRPATTVRTVTRRPVICWGANGLGPVAGASGADVFGKPGRGSIVTADTLLFRFGSKYGPGRTVTVLTMFPIALTFTTNESVAPAPFTKVPTFQMPVPAL